MWKWFKWVLLIIGFILVGIGLFLYFYYFMWMKMSPSKVKKADQALAQGITINDEKNDFVMLGSNKEELNAEDNPSPYRVGYLDLKAAQVSSDNEFIYVKVFFWDTIPSWPEAINGDLIQAIGLKFHLTDKNGADQQVLHFDYGWEPVVKFGALNTSYDFCPTGIEWPESARMACHGSDSKVYGGGGTNFIMARLPLKKIGLTNGELIYFSIDEETKSKKYTHAAVDMLQGFGKTPATIIWRIGSNSYEVQDTQKEEHESVK